MLSKSAMLAISRPNAGFVIWLGLRFAAELFAAEPDAIGGWQIRNPFPQGNPLTAVCFGRDQFVAVGYAGAVVTSPDGLHWAQHNQLTTNAFSAVTYGEGLFVAGGGAGALWTSSDGANWTCREQGRLADVTQIAWGNGSFVAIGPNPAGVLKTLVSTNGVAWTLRALPIEDVQGKLLFGNGRFALVLGGRVLTSTNGVAWRTAASGIADLAYGNGLFLATDAARHLLISTDAESWTDTLEVNPNGHLLFAKDQFFLVDPWLASASQDGRTWQPWSGTVPDGIAYGSGNYVAVPGNAIRRTADLMVSPNTLWWDNQLIGPAMDFATVAFGDGRFVASGRQGSAYALEGSRWDVSDDGLAISGLVCAQGRFVGLGRYPNVTWNQAVYGSDDGVSWETAAIAGMVGASGVVFGGDTFVAMGRAAPGASGWMGTVFAQSTDGKMWTVQTRPELWGLNLAFDGTRFLATAIENLSEGGSPQDPVQTRLVAVLSNDGRTWGAPQPIAVELTTLTGGRGRFVGLESTDTNVVWVSTNGVDWLQIRTPVPLNSIRFTGGLFIGLGAVATATTVVSSDDGIHWTQHVPICAEVLDVCYARSSFVAVGDLGVVLESAPYTPPLPPLSARLVGTQRVEVSWPAESGHSYRLQACDDLAGAGWDEIARVTAVGPTAAHLDTRPAGHEQRFYRLIAPF
jgi:hypothetical protein